MGKGSRGVDFKEQYKCEIGWANKALPYANPQDARARLREIYLTARRGNISGVNLDCLWKEVFSTLYRNRSRMPVDKALYDKHARDSVVKIASLLKQGHRYPIGRAQKLFNVFVKDLWAWGELTSEQSKVIHFPIDGSILGKLSKVPDKWKAWTKVDPEWKDIELTWDDYLSIQTMLRGYWESTNFFSYPLEMEQFMWHRVSLERLIRRSVSRERGDDSQTDLDCPKSPAVFKQICWTG